MVRIEEVAQRNKLKLYKTARPGQWKAHCPSCGDTGHEFHLYVSSIKDVFYCHKCGQRGGVVAFHAWLSGVDEATAKAQLFPVPQTEDGKPKRRVHPAERLTMTQLHELGFTRRPRYLAPQGVDEKAWYKHYKAELNWIWQEWCAHEKFEKELSERLTRLLLQAEQTHVG